MVAAAPARWIPSVVLLALGLTWPAQAPAGLFDRVTTTGYDSVTTPGVAVNAAAKFERQVVWYLRPDLKDKGVRFSIPGGAQPRALTDREGVARVQVVSPATGVFPFSARLDGNGATARGRLFVIDPARPVAVVDIDGTLSDLPDWQVPFRGASAPTYPGAVSLITDLARTHAIVYLTARDDTFDAISRAFLARHGYPDGPVLYNDLGFTSAAELAQLRSSNHGTFKLGVIRALKARGLNVRVGIGNAETDAYAYENAGLQSFIQTSVVAPGSSYRFGSYAQLRLELVARGIL